VRAEYVAKVEARLKAGDGFETAMHWAYRAALCSPDFLYHTESGTGFQPVGPAGVPPAAPGSAGKMPADPTAGTAVPHSSLDDHALASRLSYFC